MVHGRRDAIIMTAPEGPAVMFDLCHVFPAAVVIVTGGVGHVSVLDAFSGYISDARALAVLIPRALYLCGCTGRSPEKSSEKPIYALLIIINQGGPVSYFFCFFAALASSLAFFAASLA